MVCDKRVFLREISRNIRNLMSQIFRIFRLISKNSYFWKTEHHLFNFAIYPISQQLCFLNVSFNGSADFYFEPYRDLDRPYHQLPSVFCNHGTTQRSNPIARPEPFIKANATKINQIFTQ